ncbi:D-alanine--D-alanine ligase [Cyanobium sp. HWJ4-Hawea]|uniref:D-alanine--D-alanine ligase family protein n=1 Tax=Cyanobium sp. HWJ4-Hawea TaxID=2823713 RepID=UPI0020CCFEC1|nr:D-alanine--D-alanine ligase family protein [Cyanobium sp. HWJ4-Hawea]MCP9807912.1 D-alanine--D-alanine ligase [Cyanobium sp. HWJ4-Hawea]
MSSTPTRVGLIFGGASGEHAVSIRSAATVAGALRSGSNANRYSLHCFYIDQQGRWWGPQQADAVLAAASPATPESLPPEPQKPGFSGFPPGAQEIEIWFPVLHGPNGEDGTIQGLFSLMQVPFVGSGVLGSAVGMDKQAMKAAFAAAGLPQVPYACASSRELAANPNQLVEKLESQLGYPCFVKPANLGSSVGISKATNPETLRAGLAAAARLDPRLVIEKGVVARELECGVRGGGLQPLEASVLGEICFDADWYDYETKYSEGKSHTVIPAQVPAAIAERARSMAIQACEAVGAMGLSRVDFFYSEATGELWLNEINTLPGFTSQSMYPMLWAASGIPLENLVHELLEGAREWHQSAVQGGVEQ